MKNMPPISAKLSASEELPCSIHNSEHQFVIPVEWEWIDTDPMRLEKGKPVIDVRRTRLEYSNGNRVTKLRCVCGEETSR